MSTSHYWLKLFRKVHLYIGIFTAPALLFFAFTGALQSVNLHETTQGSSYKPPAWLASMAQLHKKQTTEVPVRRPRPVEKPAPKPDAAGKSVPTPPPAPLKGHWPMKIFFVIVSLGLFLSTLTGVYMAYLYARKKWVITAWLVAGTVLPFLLLPF